jgi:16S rRNA (cytosine1402-N4)-methyltransferase
MIYRHTPVMVSEVMEILKPETGKRYLDATLGGGGHAEHLLELSSPGGQVLGLDWDREAIAASRNRLGQFSDRLVTRRANFIDAGGILKEIGWEQVDGVLLDLGVSSHQIESSDRGFSLKATHRLNMRINQTQTVNAHQLVNTLPVSELERIFWEYGEERQARRFALAIDHERRVRTIESGQDLAAIIERAARRRTARIHPATRVFQALRIAVNRELENLKGFLDHAYELLVSGGRIAVISFHSLEDRIVKKTFQTWAKNCLCPPRTAVCHCGWSAKAKILTRKPLVPSPLEIQVNPRARSAKLRAAERL